MEVDEPGDSTVPEREKTMLNQAEEEFSIPPPPLSAFVANEDGSRLMMTHIVKENFKSYANVQELGYFHKYFSAILGPNGSGKSNVIDAILFVFGFRANSIRCKKVSDLIHNSIEYGKKKSCTVTVHFATMKDIPSDPDAYDVIPGSKFFISRTAFSDDSGSSVNSFYTINGKRVQRKEVCEKLRRYGVDLEHNRFLILQGDVEQISQMKPKGDEHNPGMLEYLEDIIGSSRYKDPIEKCTEKTVQMGEVKDQKHARAKLAATEMDHLQGPKDAALHYVKTENFITLLNNKLLQKKIAMAEVDKAAKAEQVSKVEQAMKELKSELSEVKKEQQTLERSNQVKLQELERVNSLKEQLRADFEARKQRDVALQQEVERSNKRRNDLGKRKKEEEEKKIAFEKIPGKNQELIAELEVREIELEKERQVAEQKHAEVLASLKQDTVVLQKERDTLQTELTELMREVDAAKAKYEVGNTELALYTSRQDSEKKKLDDLNMRLEEIVSGVDTRNETCENLKKEISKREKMIQDGQEEVGQLKQEERKIDENRRKLQITFEEARSSMQSNKSRGKVLDALMRAKQTGELAGVFGRMGDLGGIDSKYDVAISTAAGALDHIVVDTVDTAEACIMFLKNNNIGRASFVALDKQQHFRQIYTRPFRGPENAARLFDLITVADDRIRPAFYYALHDTLVAKDLEQASRIAYGATRYRVVTLAGELIEVAGTMSGGGKQVLRGRMGRTAEKTSDSVSPKEMEKMERNLEEQTRRLTELRRKVIALEEEIAANTAELTKAKQSLDKLQAEIKACTTQEPAIRKQIKLQEAKVKENAVDPAQLAKLKKVVEAAKKVLDKASEAASAVEVKVNKVQAEIVAKTKGRVDAAQKKLDDVTKTLDKARQEKTKLRVAMTTAARNLQKCEEKIVNMQKEIESCQERIKENAAEFVENEKSANAALEQFQKFDDELNSLRLNNKDYQKQHDKLTKQETELKSKEIDLKEDLTRARGEYEARVAKISADKKRVKSLKLTEEPYVVNQPQLEVLTPEQLDEVNVDDVLNDIKNAEETLPKTRPNLGAIQEYYKLHEIYLERLAEEKEASDTHEKYCKMLSEMKNARLSEFNAGLQVIGYKVKECYQMLAEGGDADLEFHGMDPFQEGITFTVRPPRKSWKAIQYLSGGEKTLSSLAIIFALHYYKPTPIYFMDEIDAALDWRNTALVGNYVKDCHLHQRIDIKKTNPTIPKSQFIKK